jgi:tRNA pseudouridine55 synthase
VLVVLIGKGTRLSEHFMQQPKQYEAVVKLGATTETLDPTSPEIPTPNAAAPPRQAIEAIIPSFVGQIHQRPPMFSAVKLAGVRAYKLARYGQAAEPAERTVSVYKIEVLGYAWPMLRLRVDCGKGTYIRSLARDIGQALGVGGHLAELVRLRVGPAGVNEAVDLEWLTSEGVEKSLQAPS